MRSPWFHRFTQIAVPLTAFVLSCCVGARADATTADDLCGPSEDPCLVDTVVQVTDGSLIDVGGRELRIAAGGSLAVGDGLMMLRARLFTVAPLGSLTGLGSPSVRGGTIEVTADTIVSEGGIDASGSTGGKVRLTAVGEVRVTGPIEVDSLAIDESGGDIDLTGETIICDGPLSAIGGRESLGGDVTLTATGDLTVADIIDAAGGDGGDISVFAGSGDAGNMTVTGQGQIKVDGSTTAGFGGEIELDVTGDGLTTGHLVMDGLVSSTGRSGSFETGGGAGGDVSVTASGDIRGAAGARYTVKGGGPDGEGGDIEFTTTIGAFDTGGVIDVGSDGTESGGGSASWDVGGDLVLRGELLGTAGDAGGGDMSLESAGASVSVLGRIEANGTADGGGGTVCLISGMATGEQATSVVVSGPILVNGGGAGGGGSIELDGQSSVIVSAPLSASGGNLSGRGGAFALTSELGQVLIDAPITGVGIGPGADGGTVSIDSQTGITLNGEVDVSGQGGGPKLCSVFGTPCETAAKCTGGDACETPGGGDVDLTSTGPIDVVGDVLAGSTSGRGGRVEFVSEGDVSISGQVITDGSNQEGGHITARACLVTVCGLDNPLCAPGSTGVLSSLGGSGTNRLVGRGRAGQSEAVVAVLGTMRANTSNGRNELVYDGTAVFQPVVFGTVTPPQTLVVDASLLPCPVCGNGETEPPETCDDGDLDDGDGCSSICQIEAGLVLGDVNGDGRVDGEDVPDLVREIYDGDGDTVARISSPQGSFPGFPGGDANEDGLVNAADITATIGLLGTP